MADTINPAAELAARQALIEAGKGALGGNGGSGSAPILMGLHLDWNASAPLSIQGKGLIKFDEPILKLSNSQPKGLGKLLADMGFNRKDFAEGFSKVAQGAGSMQGESGIQVANISQAELGTFSAGGGEGGGFVAAVSAGRSGGDGPEVG